MLETTLPKPRSSELRDADPVSSKHSDRTRKRSIEPRGLGWVLDEEDFVWLPQPAGFSWAPYRPAQTFSVIEMLYLFGCSYMHTHKETQIHIYIYINMYVCMYVYIFKGRQRETALELWPACACHQRRRSNIARIYHQLRNLLAFQHERSSAWGLKTQDHLGVAKNQGPP